MDILTFWRARPNYWIPVTAEDKARADQDIYNRYISYDHTSDSVYGRVIYLDQFSRHFQRVLGTATITEDMIQARRQTAVDLVRAHVDALHTADEVELVFACMPFKHLGLYDELFGFIHERWLPQQPPELQTPSAHPLLHKFYMDTYKKAYTLPAIARKLITTHSAHTVQMYDAADICEYHPPAYESSAWSIPATAAQQRLTLPPASPYIVSLSGGVDSMVMLALLVAAKQPVVAAHIVYGNRAVSAAEYAFIARYCARLGVPLYVYKIEWLRRGAVDREFYEAVTRDIRFHVYTAVAAATGSSTPTVLLGHIREDVVENVWSNLAKCQHLDNLAGMTPCETQMGVQICRPFLHMEKTTIYELSRTYAIPYLNNTTPAWSNRGKFRNTFYAATHAQYGAQVDKKMLEVAELLRAQSAMLERLIYRPIYESYNAAAQTLDITPAVTAGLDASGWSTIFTHACHTYLNVCKPSIHAVREFVRRLSRRSTTAPLRMDVRGDLKIRVAAVADRWILTFIM